MKMFKAQEKQSKNRIKKASKGYANMASLSRYLNYLHINNSL
jgi:hypothetical protein